VVGAEPGGRDAVAGTVDIKTFDGFGIGDKN